MDIDNFGGQRRFQTTPWGVLFQHNYIIRTALFKTISRNSSEISGRVLDFGCGSKPYESIFVNATQYIGVDIEISGHDHADSRVDVFWDGETLPFESDSFDCIVAFEVFEHVFNIESTLAEVSRVLKPGGRLLISVPFGWGEHECPYDFGRYTSFGLTSILQSKGYDVRVCEKTTGTILAVQQLFLEYLCINVFARLGVVGKLARYIVAGILNITAYIMDYFLPRDGQFYCNLVCLSTLKK